MDMIDKFMKCPVFVFGAVLGVSVIALTGALVGQFVFDLPPCNLCILQRIPFVLAALWGIAGLVWPSVRPALLGLSVLTFAGNSVLGFYHSGIERQWWDEALGCSANFDFNAGAQSLMSQITSAQVSSCAKIPWADPILGLSMANYNVLLCAGMAIFCGMALLSSRAPTEKSPL